MGKPWKIIETHEYVKAVVQSLLFHFVGVLKQTLQKTKTSNLANQNMLRRSVSFHHYTKKHILDGPSGVQHVLFQSLQQPPMPRSVFPGFGLYFGVATNDFTSRT